MENPIHVTKNEFHELMRQAEAEEATWTQIKMLGSNIALKPNGNCHVYNENTTYSSLQKAIEAVRQFQIEEWESALKLYSRIVKEFNEGREYSEYFTKEKVQHLSELILLYPVWVQNLKDGKFLITCSSEREKTKCGSVWVDVYEPENLGLCVKCGKQLNFV